MKQISISLILLLFILVTDGCKKADDTGALVPKTVTEDPTLPSITVNGAKFHVKTFGHPDSSIIFALHGGPGADFAYIENCSRLASDGYFVVLYDQRGAGLSERFPAQSYTTQQCIDDLDGIITHYRRTPAQKVFLIGHSWGAILSAGYINQHPTAIAGVVMCEPGGFDLDKITEYVARTRDYSLASETLSDIFFYNQFVSADENDHELLDYKMGLASFSDATEGNIIGNQGENPFRRFGAVCNSALNKLGVNEDLDWRTNLQAYNVPVLFMYSELNRAYGRDHAVSVSSSFGNVQLEQIPGVGHNDMISRGWDSFYPLALTYFNSLN